MIKLEGNLNRLNRAFKLQKLSGFMNAAELHRKFLQTGEKHGKLLLKVDKYSTKGVNVDGKNKKQKAKKARQQEIKSDAKEIEVN